MFIILVSHFYVLIFSDRFMVTYRLNGVSALTNTFRDISDCLDLRFIVKLRLFLIFKFVLSL